MSTECDLVYDGKCFVVVTNRVTWYEARDYCNAHCGKLAEVCDPDLNSELMRIVSSKRVSEKLHVTQNKYLLQCLDPWQ